MLESAAATVVNLLQLGIYIRGEASDHLNKVVPIIAGYLDASHPAITGVGIASLASQETLLEIEAVARILD